MERTTFGLLFYIRRDKTNKRGEAPVFMRLTINGERADASIKRFIEPHAWNSAKGKANEKSRGGKDLNLYLDAISANILRIQRDLELDKKEVSAQIILNRYLGKEQSDRHTLMEVFRAHNEKCRALSGISLAPATVIRYETTLRLTEEFLQKNYKKEDCYLDEVTNQFSVYRGLRIFSQDRPAVLPQHDHQVPEKSVKLILPLYDLFLESHLP